MSSPKLTPILTMVRTGTRTLEKVDGAKEPQTAVAAAIAFAKYCFEGKMKDGLIFKLITTETGHRPSQFKKIRGALPVFCADKNHRGLDEVLRTRHDKVKDDFMPACPDATRWSTTHHVQIASNNSEAPRDPVTHERPVTYQLLE